MGSKACYRLNSRQCQKDYFFFFPSRGRVFLIFRREKQYLVRYFLPTMRKASDEKTWCHTWTGCEDCKCMKLFSNGGSNFLQHIGRDNVVFLTNGGSAFHNLFFRSFSKDKCQYRLVHWARVMVSLFFALSPEFATLFAPAWQKVRKWSEKRLRVWKFTPRGS